MITGTSTSITLPTVYISGGGGGSSGFESFDFSSIGITTNPLDIYGGNGTMLETVTITATATNSDALYTFYNILDSYNRTFYNNWQNQYTQDPYNTPPPPTTPPVPISPNNPCNATAQSAGAATSNLIKKTTVQTQMADLDPITSTSNEQGFSIRRNTDGTVTTSPIQTLPPTGGNMTNFANSEADFHTHPQDGAPSAKDIFRLANLHNNPQIANFNTSYTKGPSGTMYAITITDETAFNNFVTANPNSVASDNGFEPTSTLGLKFFEVRTSFINAGYSALDAYERATAFILKDSGVTLLKAPSGSNDFTKIGVEQKKNPDGTPSTDANGNKVYDKSDCPR